MKTNQGAFSDWHSVAVIARKTGKAVTVSAERIIELDDAIANIESVASAFVPLGSHIVNKIRTDQKRLTHLSKWLREYGITLGDLVRLRDAFK